MEHFELSPVTDPMEISSRLVSFVEGDPTQQVALLAQFDANAHPGSEQMVLDGLGLTSIDDFEELVSKSEGYSARRMASARDDTYAYEINRTWIEMEEGKPMVTYSICRRALQATQ